MRNPFRRHPRSTALAARVSSSRSRQTRVHARYDRLKQELVYLDSELPQTRSGESMTAAGTLVRHGQATYLRRLIMPWQIRAFGFYDLLGEIKYSSQFYSRSLSNLVLYAAEKNDDGDIVETENQEVKDAVERIKDPGGGGRSGLLGAYGRLMFLVGEALLFVSINNDTELEQWEMLSTDELRLLDGNYTRFMAPTLPATLFKPAPDDAYLPVLNKDGHDQFQTGQAAAYRLHRQHPRFSAIADSTLQGALDIAEELVLLTQVVRARARSRMATAGLLFIDERITTRPDEAAPDEDALEDPFLEDLTEALTAPITDEGTAAAVVPLIARVKVPDGVKMQDLVYHLQIVDPLQIYPETGLRMECIRRLAIVLDMPPEILLGTGTANHWPCDELTEVFTADRGFVTHDHLSVGDIVLSLNHETGESEWVSLTGVRREDVEDMEMVRVKTASVDALTTPDHRWPVIRGGQRVWTDAAGLQREDRIIRAAPHANLPERPTYSDAFVELVAWFITEGTCTWPSDRHCQVRIGQSHRANPENVARIRDLLTGMFGPSTSNMCRSRGTATDMTPRWREDAEERGMTLFHLNKNAYAPLLDIMDSWRSKVVRLEFIGALTATQLELFLETFALGDGDLRPEGGLSLNQRDPARLAPASLAAVLLGRPISCTASMRRGGYKDGVQHVLNVPKTRGYDAPVGQTRREVYTGVIFCPQVPPTKSFLARRNGTVYFTGNSSWMIDEQSWKVHLQPVAEQLVGDLTSAYLQPYLKEQGVQDWGRYYIAYDASKVINHPDRSKDAKDLHDRAVIGDEALRDATGFDEDDAPTEAERATRIGILTRDSSLAWDGVPSVKAGGVEVAPGEIVSPQAGGDVGVPTGGTGADVEKGPPPGGPPDPGDEATTGAALVAARVEGVAQAALMRAREAAGSRLRTACRRDDEALAIIDGRPNREVAALLGRARVRAVVREDDLVGGVRELIVETLRLFGVDDQDAAGLIADTIERHAARTMYEPRMVPLPPSFAAFVQGLLAGNGNGHNGEG